MQMRALSRTPPVRVEAARMVRARGSARRPRTRPKWIPRIRPNGPPRTPPKWVPRTRASVLRVSVQAVARPRLAAVSPSADKRSAGLAPGARTREEQTRVSVAPGTVSVAPETVSVAPKTVSVVSVAPEGGPRPNDAPGQNPPAGRKEVGTCPAGVGGVTKLGTTGAQPCRNFPFRNLEKRCNPRVAGMLTQKQQTESFPFSSAASRRGRQPGPSPAPTPLAAAGATIAERVSFPLRIPA